eukprot:CCRYP_018241-RB/>CCRYP_018241-RB protein AED:0.15 eAED:0.15 QI:1086/0.5/0.66/1/0.5/0.66/3/195/347
MKFNRSCWTWIPALATFAFWLFILPTEIEDFHQICGSLRLRDSAIITKWLILLSHSMTMLSLSFRECVDSIIWTKVMPYRIHKHPQRFMKRLRVVLQGIRFVRFAGPLARMVSLHHSINASLFALEQLLRIALYILLKTGTLVQVLDHPTLPTLLPNMIKAMLQLSKTIGYSRVLRWILATAPAVKVVLFDPLKNFLFRHIKEDEGLMHYAESIGILSPERKLVTGSASDLFLGTSGSSKFLRRFASTTFNNSSQVGLAFDDLSPETSRQDLQSMINTEESAFSGRISRDASIKTPLSPPHRGILANPLISEKEPVLLPMSRSPSKNRRSVHFGFLDTHEGDGMRDF